MTERTHTEPQLTDRDRALLVGLADGTLRGRRLARAEARLREIPDGARLLERQGRVRRALRDGPGPVTAVTPHTATPPPAALGAGRGAGRRARGDLRRDGARHRAGQQPVAAQAAALAREPATAPAPASTGAVLRADVDGVRFPDWDATFGWRETGSRRDTLDGRATETVFYEHMGHRIAYTILPGAPVDPPEGSRIVRRDGLEIALSHDPPTAVTTSPSSSVADARA